MRPDLRCRVREDGQRRLDGRDHSGGDPAATAKQRRGQRKSNPVRDGSDHELGRFDESRRRLQRAGAPGPTRGWRSRPKTRSSSSRTSGRPIPIPRYRISGARRWKSSRGGATASSRCRWSGVRQDPRGRAARQEHVRPRDARLDLRSGPRAREGADCAPVPEEERGDLRAQRGADRGRLRLGGGEPGFPDRGAFVQVRRAHGGDERERGARHGRHRRGSAALLDVSRSPPPPPPRTS